MQIHAGKISGISNLRFSDLAKILEPKDLSVKYSISKDLCDISSTKCFRISRPDRKILHLRDLSHFLFDCQGSSTLGLPARCLRLVHDRLKGLWMTRLDVTQVGCGIRPLKKRIRWGQPACPKTKFCFNKCRIEGRSLTVTEVSFGSWARGVTVARYPIKVLGEGSNPSGSIPSS